MEFILESKEQGLNIKKYLHMLNDYETRTEKIKFEDWAKECYCIEKDYYEVTYITLKSLDELIKLRTILTKDILIVDNYYEPETSEFVKAKVLLIRDYWLD